MFFVGCDKRSRLLSMLAYVALANARNLYHYHGASWLVVFLIGALLSRYHLFCVGCDKRSRLLSMLAYAALAYVRRKSQNACPFLFRC